MRLNALQGAADVRRFSDGPTGLAKRSSERFVVYTGRYLGTALIMYKGGKSMCDTFYMRRPDGATSFFAKNSDRDPNEPQYMLFVPAGSGSTPKTYVEMPSHEVKHDVWLSKSWMWEAEWGSAGAGLYRQ